MKRAIQPFACALFGAIVGVAAVKSLDKHASAAGDGEKRVLYADEIVIGDAKTDVLTIIQPGKISLGHPTDAAETLITRGTIMLVGGEPVHQFKLDASGELSVRQLLVRGENESPEVFITPAAVKLRRSEFGSTTIYAGNLSAEVDGYSVFDASRSQPWAYTEAVKPTGGLRGQPKR